MKGVWIKNFFPMGGRFFKGCRFATGGREVVFFQTTSWWKWSV